jgi:ABC-2 type transport system ATP-binding protein
MGKIIQLEQVRKKFKNEEVIKGIDIEFESGRIYGIVGKNGSGKTVLFKMIAGYLKPTSGHIYVNDKEIGVDTDFAENMGLIIETPGFLPQYTAYQNLLYLANIRKKIGKEEICQTIELVGLEPDSRKKVGKYSLGMRQRLGIAQAIMENPDLIILDEPMNGLDKHGILLVKDLLGQLKKQGKTILMSSHYVEDMEICDEVYEMEEGALHANNI